MSRENESEKVFLTTKSIILKISKMSDDSSKKAILANLRNSISKSTLENIEVLALIFSRMPEELLGNGGELSHGEDAVLSSLQLYALHQQGMENSVMFEEEKGPSIGYSLGQIKVVDESKSISKRFNSMVTSGSFEELKNHLRHLIKLLKAKDKSVKIDYALLAKDLFLVSRGYGKNIMLKWARDYYRIKNKGEEKNEK